MLYVASGRPSYVVGGLALFFAGAYALERLLASEFVHIQQRVDIWLNLPRVPMEASGTSGMKAALNGVPQLSTLDGWWHEGYDGLNGWAIPPGSSRATPDEWDADRLYQLLEEQVVPMYYERDERGLPLGWIERMKHAVRVAGQQFTARRMLQQYVETCYAPAVRGEPGKDDPPVA
jgi:starch phosphorylase